MILLKSSKLLLRFLIFLLIDLSYRKLSECLGQNSAISVFDIVANMTALSNFTNTVGIAVGNAVQANVSSSLKTTSGGLIFLNSTFADDRVSLKLFNPTFVLSVDSNKIPIPAKLPASTSPFGVNKYTDVFWGTS